jgi:hypothetical protein
MAWRSSRLITQPAYWLKWAKFTAWHDFEKVLVVDVVDAVPLVNAAVQFRESI